MRNKITILFLTVFLSCSCIINRNNRINAEENNNVIHFVSLGASNANGFGLRGYFEPNLYDNPALGVDTSSIHISGYRKITEDSYVQLMQDYIEDLGYEADIDQLAQSSMRPEELRVLLDDSYSGDAYTKWRFYNKAKKSTWWHDDLQGIKNDYRNSIKQADIITYDLGASNFGIYLTNRLTSNNYDADINNIDSEYQDSYNSYVRSLKTTATLLGLGNVISDDMINTVAYSYIGFCNNFDKTIEKIYELNPDVKIVVIGIQNLLSGINVKLGNLTIPADKIYGFIIDDANNYITTRSPHRRKYYYVNPTNTLTSNRVEFFLDELLAYNGDPTTLSLNLKDCVDVLDTSENMMLKFRVALAICMNNGWCSEYYENYTQYLDKFVDECYTRLSDKFDEILNNVYNAIFLTLQRAVNVDVIPLDGLLQEVNTDNLTHTYRNGLMTLLNTATERCISENPLTTEEINDYIDNLVNSDAMLFAANAYVRSGIGNSFFSHPNQNGHKEVFDRIVISITTNNLIKEKPKITNLSGDEFKLGSTIYIDGQPYVIKNDNEIILNNGKEKVITTYSIKNSDSSDLYKQYPESMNVYFIKNRNGSYTAEKNINFNNIMKYSGTSVRTTGKYGIRIKTSLDISKRSKLISASGLDGYKLVEYGTIMALASSLNENENLVLIYDEQNNKYKANHGTFKYAYSLENKYDSYCEKTPSVIKYTNPLTDFTLEQTTTDFVMRPYMIIRPVSSDSIDDNIVVYGGSLTRDIAYVAYQSRNDNFGSNHNAYHYVWNIIHYAYGDIYDNEYNKNY